jgi:hypothetical protein
MLTSSACRDANVPVIQNQDETGRTKITDAVYQWFAELQLFQGKDQQGKSEKTLRAYNYRLGFFLDSEGIVAKHSLAPYTADTTWFKIKNRNYSQMAGREELFERERHKEPVAGWHSCELACAELEQ